MKTWIKILAWCTIAVVAWEDVWFDLFLASATLGWDLLDVVYETLLFIPPAALSILVLLSLKRWQ